MKKTSLFLAALLLTFSIGMTGCQNNDNNGEDEEQTEQQAEDQAAPSEDTTIDFEFEDPNDPYSGLTSDEVLNAPITGPSGDVLDNVPSNINVNRGDTPAATQGYGDSAVTFPTEAPTLVPTPEPTPDPNVTPDPNATPTVVPTPTPTPSTKANRFTLAPASAQLYVGVIDEYNAPSQTFSVTLYGGGGTVEWTSSNPAAAIVTENDASGLTATVTGLSTGKSYITARLKDTDITATAVVYVYAQTPLMFETDRCQVYRWRGEYSAGHCDTLINEVNKRRAEYNVIACVKNTGLCMCADTRAAEISYYTSDLRPDLSAFSTVAPRYFQAECIAKVPTSYSMSQIVTQINNHTQSRVGDIMNPEYHSMGASYYVFDGWAYVVLAFGY